MDGVHLTCKHCDERIGVCEPTFWRQPDGSIVDASYLAIITDPRAFDARSRFYHRDCLQPPRRVSQTGAEAGERVN